MKIIGTVVKGLQEGRLLGYPTANLEYEPVAEPLAPGVYAGRVFLGGKRYSGAVVIGGDFKNSTPLKFEVYVLNFSGDLYGKQIEVEILDKVRDLAHFEDIGALIAQIEKDVSYIRELV